MAANVDSVSSTSAVCYNSVSIKEAKITMYKLLNSTRPKWTILQYAVLSTSRKSHSLSPVGSQLFAGGMVSLLWRNSRDCPSVALLGICTEQSHNTKTFYYLRYQCPSVCPSMYRIMRKSLQAIFIKPWKIAGLMTWEEHIKFWGWLYSEWPIGSPFRFLLLFIVTCLHKNWLHHLAHIDEKTITNFRCLLSVLQVCVRLRAFHYYMKLNSWLRKTRSLIPTV